ncbi:hypothetical protein RQP46_002407 [Phenoliferia psychrophenolica]
MSRSGSGDAGDGKDDFLEDLRYAVFGLGDSSYAKYNWVAKKLSRRLDSLGATCVLERGEGDDQNEWGIESTFPKWLEQLVDCIDPLYPLEEGAERRGIEDVPPPRIEMVEVKDGAGMEKEGLWAEDVRWAKVRKLDKVTPEGWFQDVRSVELELPEGTSYEPGDVLEIRPQNLPEDVDAFLSAAGWTSIADTTYRITPSNPHQPLPSSLPTPSTTTLRTLLTHHLDLSSIPRLSFFEFLSHFTTGDIREKLQWFCTAEGQDDLTDYVQRPRRTTTEVMYEFRSANVPKEYVMDLLPELRPRGFSIASSVRKHPGAVDLLVAIVKYRTVLSVPRKGLCTSYLATLKPGDLLPVRFESSGLLKLPPGTPPLIMVGPGTGVAPFRALMEERRRIGAKENLLFFGCRSEKADFFFREEWEEMVKEGSLTLSVAASRDQEDKIYVQHRIPTFAVQIWDFLQRGGYLYVCGSSTQMPKSVKKAMLVVFREQGQLDEGGAEKLWDKLDRDGRIVEETWG